MKVLITGAGGQLGREFTENSRLYIPHCDIEIYPFTKNELDITDINSIEAAFERVHPNVVINCAAMTNVDLCETHREQAEKINTAAVGLICREAVKYDADFVQLSTDFVFDGKSEVAYTENDICSPVNFYGKSKLDSEELVRKITDRHYIVRTSWLYGRYGNSFVSAIVSKLKSGSPIKVVSDQTGSPTCTEELAKFILILIKSKKYGTYHFSGNGKCTKFEFAKLIAEHSNAAAEIIPCLTSEYISPAARPHFSVLDCTKAQKAADYIPPSWQDAFKSYYSQ